MFFDTIFVNYEVRDRERDEKWQRRIRAQTTPDAALGEYLFFLIFFYVYCLYMLVNYKVSDREEDGGDGGKEPKLRLGEFFLKFLCVFFFWLINVYCQ